MDSICPRVLTIFISSMLSRPEPDKNTCSRGLVVLEACICFIKHFNLVF